MPTPIRELECFVFDMDGTINLGETLIPGALELITALKSGTPNFSFYEQLFPLAHRLCEKAGAAGLPWHQSFAYHDLGRCDDPLFKNAFCRAQNISGRHAGSACAVFGGGHYSA